MIRNKSTWLNAATTIGGIGYLEVHDKDGGGGENLSEAGKAPNCKKNLQQKLKRNGIEKYLSSTGSIKAHFFSIKVVNHSAGECF